MYSITNVGTVPGGEAFLLINDTGTALIDTGFAFSADDMIKNAEKLLNGRALDSVLITHSHYDHASGVPYCREKWPDVKVYGAAYAKRVFERSGAMKTIRDMNDNAAEVFGCKEYRQAAGDISIDIPLCEGDTFSVGNMEFAVIETPGHTRDCISFYCEGEKLIIACETIGYPMLPEIVVPTYLVGYDMTLKSIEKLKALNAEKMLVSHLGVVDKAFIDEFLPMSDKWMKKTHDMVLDGYARGMNTEQLMAMLKEKFYCGDILTLQPEKAFDLNSYYTVTMLIKECAPKK